MEFGAPTWKPRETSYTFPIHYTSESKHNYSLITEPQYVEAMAPPDAPQIHEEEKVRVIIPFIDIFITKTKSRFASPLITKTVLSRLSHIWLHSEAPSIQEGGWYTCTWTPKEFIVKPRDFVIVWVPTDWKASEAQIPSEFLAAETPGHQSPAPELRTIQIQPSSNDGLIEHELPLSDVNDSRLMTLEYETSNHTTEKKKVREARLRAALASLKAERLAEKYYQKYGIHPGEESSELSSGDESEDETY